MREIRRSCAWWIAAVALLFVLTPLSAQDPARAEDWDRHEAWIPVRDGVKLFAVVVSAKGQSKPLPIMLVRTPYTVENNLRPRSLSSRGS